MPEIYQVDKKTGRIIVIHPKVYVLEEPNDPDTLPSRSPMQLSGTDRLYAKTVNMSSNK